MATARTNGGPPARAAAAGSVVAAAHVTGDAPAAVLLVDLGLGQVLHANDVAIELAPGVSLPVSLDAWADAASLRDLRGRKLSETDHPLSKVGRGEVVAGQAVSAARASGLGESREPLWVVGIPMQGAPGLGDAGIVVLLPIRRGAQPPTGEADPDVTTLGTPAELVGASPDSLAGLTETARAESDDRVADQLHERAVLATGLSFTVADAGDPDMALVWVNPAFTAATGYSFEEAVGHNCRFLQGPGTSRASTTRIRESLARHQTVTETLLNYRKDGLAFWNSVTMSPVRDGSGEVTHFVGVQTDVSSKVEADQERDLALEQARLARDDAQRAEARLTFLSEAAAQLSGELDPEAFRQRLLDLVVPALADMAVLCHVDQQGRSIDWAARHRDPELQSASQTLCATVSAVLRPADLIDDVLGDAPARVLADVQTLVARSTDGESGQLVGDPAFTTGVAHLRIDSTVVAAMPGRRGARDLLVLNRSQGRAPFDGGHVELITDLARRSGVMLDNVRLYQGQHHIAHTLQSSLLPRLRGLADIEVGARYLPGTSGMEVGGDFYDIAELSDASVCLAVGDVLGHDIVAAAAMGRLKGMLWALANDAGLGPAEVLERVDSLLPEDSPLASVLLVRLRVLTDADGERRWEMRSSSAGHLPIAVRYPDGTVALVETEDGSGHEQLLGLGPVSRTEHVTTVPVGTTLVAFTDGLVERRGEIIDAGLDRLQDVLVSSGSCSVEALCDELLREVEGPAAAREDDVALLVARLA